LRVFNRRRRRVSLGGQPGGGCPRDPDSAFVNGPRHHPRGRRGPHGPASRNVQEQEPTPSLLRVPLASRRHPETWSSWICRLPASPVRTNARQPSVIAYLEFGCLSDQECTEEFAQWVHTPVRRERDRFGRGANSVTGVVERSAKNESNFYGRHKFHPWSNRGGLVDRSVNFVECSFGQIRHGHDGNKSDRGGQEKEKRPLTTI
jgi:hypothetical protein